MSTGGVLEYSTTYSVRMLRNGGDGRGQWVGTLLISEMRGGRNKKRCRGYYWARRREARKGIGSVQGCDECLESKREDILLRVGTEREPL